MNSIEERAALAALQERLVAAGLTPEAARRAARIHLDGRVAVRLAPGVVLVIDTDLHTAEGT